MGRPKKQSDAGILKVHCPCCGYFFKYKRGRERNPTLARVNEWLAKARCPECGVILRLRRKTKS